MTESRLDQATIAKIVAAAKSRLDIWIRLIQLAQIRHMAEIGVWKGEFANAVLRECPNIDRYFMIDPWRRLSQWNKPLNIDDQAFDTIYDEAMRRTEFSGVRRIVLRGTTLEVIDDIADASLDLAYIDGDHTLRGVTIDLVACYAKVRPGWYLGGDDFCATIWEHSLGFEPTLVFPFALHFAEAVGATIYCLPFNQFLLRKPQARQRRFAVIDFTGEYNNADLLPQLSLTLLARKTILEIMPGPIAKALRGLRHRLLK